MPLGWIDFSKSERNKVLSVLDMLSEAGTLDELGIAPIRDGFADLFFPGTSTIQTRAKYFLIVPYALKDLEYEGEANPGQILRLLDEKERKCGQILLSGEDKNGIIGSRAMAQQKWVKRSPADIYWAGLRKYGIFSGGNLSLSEYVRAMCALKNEKTTLLRLGNRNDTAEEGNADDKDAGSLFRKQFWTIPTYQHNWIESLSVKLTDEEGDFLKRQIITSSPELMLAHILRNNMTEILACASFQDLSALIRVFPEQIQQDYALAYDFSDFLYVLRTVYNITVSEGKNEAANLVWEDLKGNLDKLAEVDLDAIFGRLNITRNTFLCNFLLKSRKLMKESDLTGMMTEIKRRERELKQSRAKTLHPGEFDPNSWFGGGQLDYRFSNAKVIIRDIFESRRTDAES
ncbi:MAG: hypothetical protein IJI41_13300 [Anaerolineaceae bacterium]|nr:hypothetical protein [Anaerolineaceae bacterium]